MNTEENKEATPEQPENVEQSVQSEETPQTDATAQPEVSLEDMPQGGIDGVPFPDFPDTESTAAAIEPQPTESEVHEAALASAHDDFDWDIDKRNVTTYNKAEREKYDEVYDL